MDSFWKIIDSQLKELASAKSADDVIRILRRDDDTGCGDAFFDGSGGNRQVSDSLEEAGWEYVWSEWGHHYAIKAPDGSVITYCEGDIYKGDQRA